MNSSPFRPLTNYESHLIRRLLEKNFPGRDALVEQMENCLVRTIGPNGCLEFQVNSQVKADVKWRIPTEAHVPDADGMSINILLHVIDGKLKELEIYKSDSSPVIKMPDPAALEIWQPGEIWDR
jgi:hypothetical protein